MNNTSKKYRLFLGITSLILSRGLFVFFDDPEGPNLLIVTVTALIVYLFSLSAYKLAPSATDAKKFFLAVFIQALTLACFYIFLH